jgi:hypothetical protein
MPAFTGRRQAGRLRLARPRGLSLFERFLF